MTIEITEFKKLKKAFAEAIHKGCVEAGLEHSEFSQRLTLPEKHSNEQYEVFHAWESCAKLLSPCELMEGALENKNLSGVATVSELLVRNAGDLNEYWTAFEGLESANASQIIATGKDVLNYIVKEHKP